jgi:hypothetical protein
MKSASAEGQEQRRDKSINQPEKKIRPGLETETEREMTKRERDEATKTATRRREDQKKQNQSTRMPGGVEARVMELPDEGDVDAGEVGEKDQMSLFIGMAKQFIEQVQGDVPCHGCGGEEGVHGSSSWTMTRRAVRGEDDNRERTPLQRGWSRRSHRWPTVSRGAPRGRLGPWLHGERGVERVETERHGGVEREGGEKWLAKTAGAA